MKNLKDVMAVVKAPDFHQRLLDDNERSVRFYNKALGFGDLKRVLANNPDMTSGEIFRLCDLFFTEDRIRQVISEEQFCADRNPFYGSSFQPIGADFFGGMVLASTDQFSAMLLGVDGYEIALAKQRTDNEKRTLTFGGQETFLKFFRARNFPLQAYRIQNFDDADDLAATAPTFTKEERHTCETGDTISFGADESFEYCAEPGSHALVLQVQMYRGGLPMALEFDFDSGSLVGASAPSQEPTRLQMLATAMRLFDRKDAGEQMERLLEHPSHFVRWHAMREYLGLDFDRAWPHLERMHETDPQPAVRRAAGKTIELLNPTLPIAAE